MCHHSRRADTTLVVNIVHNQSETRLRLSISSRLTHTSLFFFFCGGYFQGNFIYFLLFSTLWMLRAADIDVCGSAHTHRRPNNGPLFIFFFKIPCVSISAPLQFFFLPSFPYLIWLLMGHRTLSFPSKRKNKKTAHNFRFLFFFFRSFQERNATSCNNDAAQNKKNPSINECRPLIFLRDLR